MVLNLIANFEAIQYSMNNVFVLSLTILNRVRVEHKLMSLVWAFSFFMVQYNDVVGRKEAQSLLLCSLLI